MDVRLFIFSMNRISIAKEKRFFFLIHKYLNFLLMWSRLCWSGRWVSIGHGQGILVTNIIFLKSFLRGTFYLPDFMFCHNRFGCKRKMREILPIVERFTACRLSYSKSRYEPGLLLFIDTFPILSMTTVTSLKIPAV